MIAFIYEVTQPTISIFIKILSAIFEYFCRKDGAKLFSSFIFQNKNALDNKNV